MEVVIAAKMLSDFSMYFMFASFLGSLFGLKQILTVPMLIFAVSGFLCWGLRKKGVLRFLPLLLIALCALFAKDKMSYVVLIPPAIYCVVICAKLLYAAERGFAIGQLRFGLIAGVVLTLIAVAYIRYHTAVYGTMTFLLVFALSTILLIRMLRFDAAALSSVKLKLSNLALLVFACVLGLLFSSKLVLTGVGAFFGLLIKYVFAPILSGIVRVFGLLVAVIGGILKGKKIQREALSRFGKKLSAEELDLNTGTEKWAGAQTIVTLIVGFIAIIVLIVLFFVFKRMVLGRYKEAESGKRETGSVEGKNRSRVRSAHGPREQVRECYRRFLQLCRKRGVKFTYSDTSLDIDKAASPVMPAEAKELRKIYIRARYDEKTEVPASDVKTAKDLYSTIKNAK